MGGGGQLGFRLALANTVEVFQLVSKALSRENLEKSLIYVRRFTE